MSALTVPTVELAKYLVITPAHVRQLEKEGVLEYASDVNGKRLAGRWQLLANVRAYVIYQRKQERQSANTAGDFYESRNRKMVADAERAELELKLLKGELHRGEDVDFILTNLITAAKQALLAIPSRTSRLLIGLTDHQQIYNIQYLEIEAILNAIAGYDGKQFEKLNRAYLAKLGRRNGHKPRAPAREGG